MILFLFQFYWMDFGEHLIFQFLSHSGRTRIFDAHFYTLTEEHTQSLIFTHSIG